jgi:chloramphenicol-sensitive protein RarD
VLVSSGLIAVNWGTYIWAVNAGFIVETSLGYFINPLVNVVLGVVLLKEKLRPAQWIPVGLALLGVLYLTIGYGRLPWIALALAFSFGLYGLAKKTAPLGALHGLTLETSVLSIPSGLYLFFLGVQGRGSFLEFGTSTDILLVFTGVVTALPLLLFGMGARRITLITVGLLQYIAPTCQFLLGVLVYNELLTVERLVGFCIIWLSLLIYTLEGLLARRRSAASPIV